MDKNSDGPFLAIFEGKTEKEKESIIIVLIWLMIPCAIFFGRGEGSTTTLLDIFPNLIPWFVLWLFFGWVFPVLYFKWKHRNKKIVSTQNSLIKQPIKKKFYQTKLFFFTVIVIALFPVFATVREILFIYGISKNDTELVKSTISLGVNVNKFYEDTSPLMAAIQSRNVEMVSILIDAGADITLKNSKGDTALSNAKKLDDAKIIDILK